MPSLAKHYPDLLPTLDDPALNRLVTDLDRAYGAANPTVAMPIELRENIAATLVRRAGQPPAPAGGIHLPRAKFRRAGLAAILLAALLGGGILSLALYDHDQRYSIPHQAPYGLTPQFAAVMTRYGHQIAASQQACGYTVAVRRAYADANRITVAVSIQGSPIRTILFLSGTGAPTLTDAQGAKLRWLGGTLGGTTGSVSTLTASFDAHGLSHDIGPLRLRFTLPSFTLAEGYNSDSFFQLSCERYRGAVSLGPGYPSLVDHLRALGARLAPMLFQPQTAQTVRIDQSFSIPFTVPLDPVRTEIRPQQTVTAGGVTLILDQVIATRSETRVYLRRTVPGSILQGANLTLSGGGDSCRSATPLFGDHWTRQAPASRRYDFAFTCAFYHQDTPYTLVVRPNPYAHYRGQPWLVLRGGPWIFHFSLP